MKKLATLVTILILTLTTTGWAAFPETTNVTLNSACGWCTISADHLTITCPTNKSEGSYLTVAYTKDNETSVIITPKFSYIGSDTIFSNLADPDVLASGVTSGVYYNVMANIAYKMIATGNKTWKVMYPVRAKYVQYIISFPDSGTATTLVDVYSEPISKPLF